VLAIEPPRQWQWIALWPIAAGLFAIAQVGGVASAILAGMPGVFLLMSGMSLLLMPGDPRITGYMAVAGALGTALSLPLMFATGFFDGLVFGVLCAGSFIVAGRSGLFGEPVAAGAPLPDRDLRMQIKAGLDEVVIGYFLGAAKVPSGEQAARICGEAPKLQQALESRGWLEHPEGFHQKPEAPLHVNVQSARSSGLDYEQVRFDSEYLPPADLPGAEVWATHTATQRTAAWLFRHPGPARPWLLCIHGYRMGEPWIDFSLFAARVLHHRYGLNLLMPILPLHGPRRIGRLSGDGFLDGDPLDLLYAEAQALWDLRRWLAWLRANEPAPRIGVYGVSLGGYNTALLSAYEDGLDFAVAGIPVVDLAAAIWRFIPPQHRRYFVGNGLEEARYREILRAVSPLTLRPRLPSERLHIFAATGDRLLPASHALALSRHWERPVHWYQGSHLSVRRELTPRTVLKTAMTEAGWKLSDGLSD
jgi:hypothetical protein